MNTAIVILAAGNSSRLGKSKQLLRLKGTSLLKRAVDSAFGSNANLIVVVLGANVEIHSDEIESSKRVHIVENNEWELGMGSSLKLGLKTALKINSEINSVIFSVCDQPYLSHTEFNLLITASEINNDIIASKYKNGVSGVPVLFKRNVFSMLLALNDDFGAKQILNQENTEFSCIQFNEGDIDVDTEEDYQRIKLDF